MVMLLLLLLPVLVLVPRLVLVLVLIVLGLGDAAGARADVRSLNSFFCWIVADLTSRLNFPHIYQAAQHPLFAVSIFQGSYLYSRS